MIAMKQRIGLSVVALSIITLSVGYIYSLHEIAIDRETSQVNLMATNKVIASKAQGTAVIDGVEMHTRCEDGWCFTSAHQEDIDSPIITDNPKTGSGVPVIDLGAYAEVIEGQSADNKRKK